MSVCSIASNDGLAALYPLPLPSNEVPRPMNDEELGRIETCARLQFFLATAPTRWAHLGGLTNISDLSSFRLPSGESVSCVLWNGLFHITGTDIVRSLAFRFAAFGRPVRSMKKWEEGVFSDLRNLKHGVDAILEEPKSPLLDFLFRYGCIRTQKKQKVFFWFSVPHDRLFLDALERDLKREKMGQEPTSAVTGEPARSFRYDPKKSLYEQFAGQNQGLAGPGNLSIPFPDTEPSGHHSTQATAQQESLSQAYPSLETSVVDNGGPIAMVGSYMSSMSPPRTSGIGRPSSRHDSEQSESFESETKKQRYRARTVEAPRSSSVKRPRARTDFLLTEPEVEGESEKADKPFTCPFRFCARPFRRLEHLKRHVRTHTHERPFACQHCSRSFSRRDNLLQHERIHVRLGDTPAPTVATQTVEMESPATTYERYRSETVLPDPLVRQAGVEDSIAHFGQLYAFPAADQTFDYYRPTALPQGWAPGPDLSQGQFYVQGLQ